MSNQIDIAIRIFANGDYIQKIILLPGPFSIHIENGSAHLKKSFSIWMDAYLVKSPLPIYTFQLDTQGTLFQQKAWKEISKVPFGTTLSYKLLGKNMGSETYARAVGNACNQNRFPLLIPCHRIVQTNGNLGGFAYSKKIKEILLEHEKK